MERADRAHARCERGRGRGLCGAGADGGGEAAGASGAISQLDGGAAGYTGPAIADRGTGRMEGIIPRLGGDGDARGAVYGDPISAVGRDEGVEKADGGQGGDYGRGERGVWEYFRGGGGGVYDAVGCVEDEVDVGEGEAGADAVAEPDFERFGASGFLCGDGAQSPLDLGWRGDLSR